MPKLTIDDATFEIPAGKRLINAITDEGGSDQLHNCGGKGACTSCRVIFTAGEPEQMTQIEKDLLTAKGLTGNAGMRLSCQMTCDADMSVKIISHFAGSGRRDAGSPCAAVIEPPPVWIPKA